MISRILLLFILTVFAVHTAAQSALEPRVTVELDGNEAMPGQPLDLRVTVLVPTWMTKPVAFPSFEAPDLLVQLPERATNPISERIDRETWSGVTRRYRITPMVPGRTTIPAQDLIVTWADPDTNVPREDRVTVAPLVITGVLPEGAEDLVPFLAASEVTLTQTISGAEAPLKPGDSVIREVTATITGAPAIFLPSLLDPDPVQGVTLYPNEPVVTDTSKGSSASGTRAERVTYLAQSGGNGVAGAVSLSWYNIETGGIETVSVPEVPLGVDAPVARSAPGISPRALILLGVALGAVVLLLTVVWRPLTRWWSDHRAQRIARYLASASYARDQLHRAVRRHDYAECLTALDLWAARVPGGDPRRDPGIAGAIAMIGAARYGNGTEHDERGWAQLEAAVLSFSSSVEYPHREAQLLPSLNPNQ